MDPAPEGVQPDRRVWSIDSLTITVLHMTSQRHSEQHHTEQHHTDYRPNTQAPNPPRESVRPGAPNRVSEAELLRAARDCVLDKGVRRSTLTEIARRAGVSRMTLYRRFPDVHSIVTVLMTAEFAMILHRARAEEGTGSARQRLVTAVTRCVVLLQVDPLLRRVLASDAELLLPYLVERLGSTQLTAERFIRQYLADGYSDGSIRQGDPNTQARMLLLTAQTMVVSSRPAVTGTDQETLSAELAHSLDAILCPDLENLCPEKPVPRPESTSIDPDYTEPGPTESS